MHSGDHMKKKLVAIAFAFCVSVVPIATAQAADSAVMFATSAKGDLKDLNKDLNDLLDAIAKGSTFRLITNSAELSFNIAQLASLNPPTSVATSWKQQFGALQKSITAVQKAISDDSSMSTLKSRINSAKKQLLVVNGVVAKVK